MTTDPTATIRNQSEADALIPPALSKGPIHLRIDPMEGRIDLIQHWYTTHNWHNWLTGETGIGRTTDNLCSHPQTGQRTLSVTVSGGEKPIHPDWVREIRDACAAAGVPFTFESWGEHQPLSLDGMNYGPIPPREIMYDGKSFCGWMEPDGETYSLGVKGDTNRVGFVRVGRERSGRTLDGRVHEGEGTGSCEG
jgi:hypothetical protein